MSRSPHTPGPWSLSKEGAPSPLLTRITGSGAAVWAWSDSDRANAQLIAAAPELLAALKAIEALINQRPLVMGATTLEGQVAARVVFDQARAAVAKATGEESCND